LIRTNKRLDRLHLSKIGDIPIRLYRTINGKVKGVIVKRYRTGEWYALFQVEVKPELLSQNSKVVGIDVGIKHFLTDSDGRQIENPNFYKRSIEKIKKYHRYLSRKKRGLRNRNKARVKLSRAYQKLERQRDDFLHKLSRFYVNNYKLIAIEDLSITSMVRGHYLAKRILDASWGKFFQMLTYKAASAGRLVIKVDPRGTSQEYNYGNIDRDYDASLNILIRALGQGLSEVTPVEIEPLPELIRVPASSIIEAGSPFR